MNECNHEDHGLFHVHAPGGKLRVAFFFTIGILVIELIGGILSNSLALLSDAGHVLTDLAAIGFSWYAVNQGQRPPSASMTFGYHRIGILTAFLNALTLLIIAGIIIYEAIDRFHSPLAIDTRWMFLSAGIGLLVNLWLGLGMREASHDINVRAAMLHVLSDAAASAGVLIGGLVIGWTGFTMIDPLLSIGIAGIIAVGAWNVLRRAVSILLEGTPSEVNMDHLIDLIWKTDGVLEVHDLHVWSLTSNKNALSCHIVIDGNRTVSECQNILRELEHQFLHLGIGHSTIQIEDSGNPHQEDLFCIGNQIGHHSHRH